MFVLSSKKSELKAAVKHPGPRISNPAPKDLKLPAHPFTDAHSKSANPNLRDLLLTSASHLTFSLLASTCIGLVGLVLRVQGRGFRGLPFRLSEFSMPSLQHVESSGLCRAAVPGLEFWVQQLWG